MSCKQEHTGPLERVFCNPIPPISSDKVECDIAYTVDWLNALAEATNKNCQVNHELVDKVNELNARVECLEARVDAIDAQIININNRLDNHEHRLNFLEEQLTNVNNIFNQLSTRIDWIFNRLPGAYGTIPDDWKFAMGNISLMSANNGTPSMSIGIFTSLAIEDNDVYAN